MSTDYSQLHPFPVDAKVLASIRPMTAADCEAVSRQHYAAMGKSLWAQLGLYFLRTLYQELLRSPLFLAYVYEENGQVGGFIAGSTDSQRLFREVLLRSWFWLVPAVLLGILRRPQVIANLLTTATYFKRSSRDASDSIPTESLFCSFRPDLRGKRISGHINKVLFEEFLRRGCKRIKITTETDNPDSNRQLKSWGFQQVHHFSFYGKDMVTYVLELTDHPRLHP